MRIRAHCKSNNIINPSQFGFQPGKSTEMAAGKFITEIIKGLNKRMPVLLDFQAAFDTLWQKALIYKMHKMKFDKNIINLVKDYLSNRKFIVKVGQYQSEPKRIVAGARSFISHFLPVIHKRFSETEQINNTNPTHYVCR